MSLAPTKAGGKGKGPAPKAPAKKEAADDDEPKGRRFRVTIKLVASVDLQSISDFCQGKVQGVQAATMMASGLRRLRCDRADQPCTQLTAVMCINVLLLVDVSASLLTSLLVD